MEWADVSHKPFFVEIPVTMPAYTFSATVISGPGAIFGGGSVTSWTEAYQPVLDSIMQQVQEITR